MQCTWSIVGSASRRQRIFPLVDTSPAISIFSCVPEYLCTDSVVTQYLAHPCMRWTEWLLKKCPPDSWFVCYRVLFPRYAFLWPIFMRAHLDLLHSLLCWSLVILPHPVGTLGSRALHFILPLSCSRVHFLATPFWSRRIYCTWGWEVLFWLLGVYGYDRWSVWFVGCFVGFLGNTSRWWLDLVEALFARSWLLNWMIHNVWRSLFSVVFLPERFDRLSSLDDLVSSMNGL